VASVPGSRVGSKAPGVRRPEEKGYASPGITAGTSWHSLLPDCLTRQPWEPDAPARALAVALPESTAPSLALWGS
jgi:hypothetical protein